MAGRRFVALVALLGCALVACSEAEPDDEPAPEPSESAVSDVRESDARAPTLPPAARKDSLEGAEAFIRHYIDLLNYATATGEVHDLHATARGCESCLNYERLYRTTYKRGGFMRYSGWNPRSVEAFDQRGKFVVLTDVHSPRIRYRLTRASEEKVGPSAEYKFRFEVKRISGKWVVTDFSQQDMPDNL